MKECKNCLTHKEEKDFHKESKSKDGLRTICIVCVKEYQFQWRSSKRSILNQKSKEYQETHKEEKKEYDKNYRLENIDKINSYLEDNKDMINKRSNIYSKNKRKVDINFKISQSIRNRIGKFLNRDKSYSSVTELGCSINELRNHLESKFLDNMSWDNYGKWHIDHISPLSKFDLTKPDEFKKACHYSNLQPLWALDNIKKSNKI